MVYDSKGNVVAESGKPNAINNNVALEAIFAAAKTVDQKTMTLQYFETLKSLGMSPSTKYIFPMEFTSMLDNFLGKSK